MALYVSRGTLLMLWKSGPRNVMDLGVVTFLSWQPSIESGGYLVRFLKVTWRKIVSPTEAKE